MTHSSSQFASGGAITNTVAGSSGGFGVKWWGTSLLDIVPLTLNATGLAASQSLAGAGALTLTAGTSVTATVVNGVTRYVLDVARCVTVTSAGVDTGITFTVKGYDIFGAPMTDTMTGGSTAAVTTKKAFASVISITGSGATASTVTAGTADVFGLPVQVIDKGYLTAVNWAESFATDSGTATVADTTSPATALTGDVRGTYAPSSASNGTRRLVIQIALNATQLSGTPAVANTTAIVGVTQF